MRFAVFGKLPELEKKNGQTKQPDLPERRPQEVAKPFHSSRSNTLEDI